MTYLPGSLPGVSRAYAPGIFFLRGASRLDAFSVYPVRTSLPCYAVGTTTVAPEVRPNSGPLVLGTAPLMIPTPTMDRDRTVSRRSEPSSRAALIGEQPNPWDLASAPGCDEPTSRCQNTPVDVNSWGGISLLSPEVAFIR